MENQVYIIDLKFGIWENQIWFEAEPGKTKSDWETALSGLDAIADKCQSSGDYFNKATLYLEDCGFKRIQR